MVLNFAANLLNRLKWTSKLPHSEVVILHRGAPNDMKKIRGDNITEIKKDHFSYMESETMKEVYIPMHRVLEIWMGTKLVWKKRGKCEKNAGSVQNGKDLKSIMEETVKLKKKQAKSAKKRRRGRKSSRRR